MRKALCLALAWLCLAAQASPAANLEVRRIEPLPGIPLGSTLQASLPNLNLPPAELATLTVLSQRFQDASMSIAALAPETPLAGPAAAQAVLSSVQELRARYSDDELKNLSPGELNGVAQQFIDRLQGAASASGPAATAPSSASADFTLLRRSDAVSTTHAVPLPAPSIYLLSRPLEVNAHLRPVAQGLHYVGEIGFQFLKAYGLWKAGLHAAAVSGMLAFELVKTPPMISAQSMADLQIRYWWKKLSTLKDLARIPEVERINVLTATETHFKGVVAQRQENRGLIFLESSQPLRLMSTIGFGEPFLIEDPKATRIRLTFSLNGRDSTVHWTPTLQELRDKKPIPDDAAAAWRSEIREAKKSHGWFRRFFDYVLEKNMKVNATLIDPSGREKVLGTLTQGQSTKRLLGITRWDQALRAVKTFVGISPARIQNLFTAPSPYKERSIPLSVSLIERETAPFSWRALPSRVWRRLLGRLIVIRP